MAPTPSTMVSLGTPAHAFQLPDTLSGKTYSLDELKSATATVVMFICNHCPYVKHIQPELVRLANDYIPQGISFIAINSNDVKAYPEDAPEEMKTTGERLGYPFPYLYDESQAVARAYKAACTPDIFVYDSGMRLVYRGQLDDSRPSNGLPVTGRDVRDALDNLLAGKPVNPNQRPSVGCNIKWKNDD